MTDVELSTPRYMFSTVSAVRRGVDEYLLGRRAQSRVWGRGGVPAINSQYTTGQLPAALGNWSAGAGASALESYHRSAVECAVLTAEC